MEVVWRKSRGKKQDGRIYGASTKKMTWTFTTLLKEQRRKNVKQVNTISLSIFVFLLFITNLPKKID